MDFAETLEPDEAPKIAGAADADAAPLGLLLGADSLLSRRSGIGRVTMEIARHLRDQPGIAGHSFLVRGKIHTPRMLWELLRDQELAPILYTRPVRSPMQTAVLSRLGRFAAFRKLNELRRRLLILREVRNFRARMKGRLVYYEPNFIASPFDGVTVVEVNDLSWHHHPEWHPAERIAWMEQNLPRTLKQARRFVSISHFTADAMVKELGVDPSRIDVVALAPSDIFRPVSEAEAAPVLANYGLQDGAYVLSVSTLEPRKNFDRLLAAHSALPQAERLRFPLVIAGGIGWGEVLSSAAAEAAAGDGSLRLLGHVSDEELCVLMARCTTFAYVSLYEGFGLPVIEAMASGAPVIASKTTAVGETAGDAAILVDPLDDGEICAAMRHMIEDDDARQKFRKLGFTHAAKFTWSHTMTELAASWRRALADL